MSIYVSSPKLDQREWISGFNMNEKGFGKSFTNLITNVVTYYDKLEQRQKKEKEETKKRSKNLGSVLSTLNKKN